MSVEEHPLSRVELLLGLPALEDLQKAHVTVAGIGAVGSFAVEALARSGIGHLCLIDFDTIHVTNLNRQLFATTGNIGQSKIDVAAAHVRSIAPACRVEPVTLFITQNTVEKAVEHRPDVLIDAIDSVNPKTMLLQAAVQSGIPVISTMGAATRLDPLSVRMDDISRTQHCPLARFIRKRLRRRGIYTGIHCVYSIEPKRTRTARGSIVSQEDPSWSGERGRPRTPLGSLCPVPGIFGLTAASEAIRMLLGDTDIPSE